MFRFAVVRPKWPTRRVTNSPIPAADIRGGDALILFPGEGMGEGRSHEALGQGEHALTMPSVCSGALPFHSFLSGPGGREQPLCEGMEQYLPGGKCSLVEKNKMCHYFR